MPLRQGEVHGYDFNRMVVEFTMLNQDTAKGRDRCDKVSGCKGDARISALGH
jgi:hypothetical protein